MLGGKDPGNGREREAFREEGEGGKTHGDLCVRTRTYTRVYVCVCVGVREEIRSLKEKGVKENKIK